MLPKSNNISIQTFYFHLIFTAANLAVWAYYIALLLKASNYDLGIVFLNQGAIYVGMTTGFLLAGRLFKQFQYTNSYRAGMLILALASFISLITLPNILQVHLFVAIIRGIGEAFFWVTHHVASTRDIVGEERKIFQGRTLAASDLLSILIAPLAGGIIAFAGYEWIFIITTFFYIAACFMPWNNIPKSKEKLQKKDIRDVIKSPNFGTWAWITYIEDFMLTLRNISTAILPFLLITSEFEIGLFMAFIAFIGSIISIWESHRSDKLRRKLGYFGALIIIISNFILVGSWNLAGLGIRSVLARLGFSFYNPKKAELKYQQRELLIKDFRGEHALEVQIIAEIVLFAARMSAMAIILSAIYLLRMDPLNVLYLMFVVTIFREGMTLWMDERLVRQMRV